MAINMTKLCVSIDRSMALQPERYGNKAVNLARMIKAGLPVPPAFVLSTESLMGCQKITLSDLLPGIKELEEKTGKEFGSTTNPLFLSVRSSPPFSLPGLLQTELNISNEEQLVPALQRVRESWNNEAARIYRTLHSLPDSVGTAVIIQSMVFGDLNERSGAGVLFTCDPITGEDKISGRFSIKAQGKSIVSRSGVEPKEIYCLKDSFPQVSKQIIEIKDTLEREFKNAQEIEFVIEDSKLWVLQTRDAMLYPPAQVRASMILAQKNIINSFQLLDRLGQSTKRKTYRFSTAPYNIPRYDDYSSDRAFGMGKICASPGAAQGPIAFSLETAREFARAGNPAILMVLQRTEELQPALLSGTIVGLVTRYGHEALHEAVLARALGIPMLDGDILGKDEMNSISHKIPAYLIGKTLVIGCKQITEGTEIVMDADSRYLWVKESTPPIKENEVVNIGDLQFDYSEEEKTARMFFGAYDYKALTFLHAKMIEDIVRQYEATQRALRLNLDAHVIHQLIIEKGGELGKSAQEIEKDILKAYPRGQEKFPYEVQDRKMAEKLGIVETDVKDYGFGIYFLPYSTYGTSLPDDEVRTAIEAHRIFVEKLYQSGLIDLSKIKIINFKAYDPMPHGHGSMYTMYDLGIYFDLGFSSRLKMIELLNKLIEEIAKNI